MIRQGYVLSFLRFCFFLPWLVLVLPWSRNHISYLGLIAACACCYCLRCWSVGLGCVSVDGRRRVCTGEAACVLRSLHLSRTVVVLSWISLSCKLMPSRSISRRKRSSDTRAKFMPRTFVHRIYVVCVVLLELLLCDCCIYLKGSAVVRATWLV